MAVKVLLGYSAAKKKRKSVSLVLQQYDTRRGKSPGRKVKVGDMITPPTAQTAEPRCSERDTSQVQFFLSSATTVAAIHWPYFSVNSTFDGEPNQKICVSESFRIL